MKLKVCFFLSLFLPLVTSCNTEKESNDSIKGIDIVANMDNLKQLNLSQFTNEIQYIPLESGEDAPLSIIREFDIKDNNIITAEGGFIGIGKNKKLKQDFNDKFFTKIDITKTTQIPIPGKKPKIITNHPTESYKISGEGDSAILEIINANSFWKSSKYLVVVID